MKSLSERMEQADDLFKLILDNLEDYAVFLLDPDGRIATWNRGAQRLLGYTSDQSVGQPISIIYTKQDIERGIPEDELARATREGSALNERWHLRADGSRFWASGHLSAIHDNDTLVGFIKIVRDLTERHQQEQMRNRQLREVALRLTRVEQHEREQLATDLHSTLAQELLSCRLKLAGVKPADDASTRHRDEIYALLDQSMHYVRNLIASLSPKVLQTMTLGEAFASLAERLERDHQLKVHLDVDRRGIPLLQAVRVLLFQAAHELLLNVTKHAGVHEAELALWRDEQRGHLRISDRGAGFDAENLPTEPSEAGGFGLMDVRDRVQMLGGSVDIHSIPDEGTTITLSVPLMEEIDGSTS